MHEFLVFTISGITTAGIYAITASGLTLTYVTTGVFNFAHGATGAFGAFLYWQLHVQWNWPTVPAILFVLLVFAPLFGVGLERIVMRRLEGTSDATKLVVTIGVLVTVVAVTQLIWKPDTFRTANELYAGHTFSIGSIDIPYNDVIVLAIAGLVAIGLRFLLYRTRVGIAMRATVDDPGLTVLTGARPTLVSQVAWSIGTALACLAGILVAPKVTLSATTLTLLIVNAYAASMIGRLRSLPMTFVGALIVGLANDYGVGYLPKIKVGSEYIAGLQGAIPVVVLFIAVLVMKQSRLRGHATLRTREVSPVPTWPGSLFFALVVVVGALAALPLISQADMFSATKMWGVALIALSIIPLTGYAGRLSLCQLSFAGIGAVTVAHAGAHGELWSILLAMAIPAAVGAVISLPALRLSGIYLALLTGAFAVALDRWIFQLPPVRIFGHNFDLFQSGSLTLTRFNVLGWHVNSSKSYFVFGAIVFGIAALAVTWVRRSDFGQRLIALKESPAACATLGMNPRTTTLAVFTFSAALAGLGGALYGVALQSATPDMFDFFTGLSILLVVVIAGVSSIGGALWAAIFLGTPITSNLFTGNTAQITAALTGLGGVGLGDNPNGVIAAQLRPPWRTAAPAIRLRAGQLAAAAAAVIAVGLYFLAYGGAITSWVFVIGFGVILLGTPAVLTNIAKREEPAEEKKPEHDGLSAELEWIGLDAPVSAADLRVIDQHLALESVAGAVAGSAHAAS
jgi:branched-chain amino acid transport system permease protein